MSSLAANGLHARDVLARELPAASDTPRFDDERAAASPGLGFHFYHAAGLLSSQ